MSNTEPAVRPAPPRHPVYDRTAILVAATGLAFVAFALGLPWHALSVVAMAATAYLLVWALAVLRENARERAAGQALSRPIWQLAAARVVFWVTGITMITVVYVVTVGRL